MRLIDADALVENINKIYKGYMTDECGCTPCDFENIVDEQPAAYDIEKVVEELEDEIKLYENSMSIMGGNDADIEYYGAMKGLGKAIEIVKRGGKDV